MRARVISRAQRDAVSIGDRMTWVSRSCARHWTQEMYAEALLDSRRSGKTGQGCSNMVSALLGGFPGNANLPIGAAKIANREIGVPGVGRRMNLLPAAGARRTGGGR